MSRKRVVALSSVAVILLLGVLGIAAFYGLTGTSFGREWMRGQIAAATKGAHGRVYVGRLSGGMLTGVTVDSLEIRDTDGVVFVATGPVTAHYDPRDLLDRRVLISRLDVARPYVNLVRHADGSWNWRRIFPAGPPSAPRQPGQRSFGDFIVANGLHLRGGAFVLTMPWSPADSLKGARRDSAVRVALADTLHEYRRGPEGLTRTWRWTEGVADAGYVRLADPDSTGRVFDIARLSARESDPPMSLRDVRARVRVLGDSAWLDVPQWKLPASHGSAAGKVVWGGTHPILYDVHVRGDSVSLDDVAWVYPTLPRTGGGHMLLDISNDPSNLSVLRYALSRMDVRTTASRLTGDMTFSVGGPVLAVTDVAVDARPIDFALIRALNGKPFPYDWKGEITGRVVARGGPLNRFQVDSARFVFADAHVPGAVSRGSARGGLDILFPAYTTFRGLDVQADQVDLRTIEFLNPRFPRLGGLVSGHARLDSVWTDVRFSAAEVTHADGPGAPTVAAGDGRLTIGDKYITYDLALDAHPLSLTTLARSYPLLPVRGTYAGPLRLQGTLADLLVQGELTGPAGRIALDGRVGYDVLPYSFRGTATLTGFDASQLGTGPVLPATLVDADLDADVRGSSLATLAGAAGGELRRSTVAGEPLRSARARLRFEGGRLLVDTLDVDAPAFTAAARGGLGLAAGASDTLRLSLRADSLGGLRRRLKATEDDTLAGSLAFTGRLVGTLDTLGPLSLAGTLTGEELRDNTMRAHTLGLRVALDDILGAPHGTLALSLDTAALGPRTLAHAALDVTASSATRAAWAFGAEDADGDRLMAAGRAEVGPAVGAMAVSVDSAAVGSGAWRLARGGWLRRDSAGLAIDTMLVRGPSGAAVTVGGTLPNAGVVAFSLTADSVPLAELGHLAQLSVPLTGLLTARVTVGGSRAMPLIDGTTTVANAQAGAVRLEYATARARYADRRIDGSLDLLRDGRTAITASARLPFDLALLPVARRRLDGPIAATVRSDSVDLSVLQTFLPSVERASGLFRANVSVAGTWQKPELTGAVTVQGGAMTLPSTGVRLQRIDADVALSGDSVSIRNVSAGTVHAGRAGRAALTGLVRVPSVDSLAFDLRLNANSFFAFNRPRVAALEVSTAGGGLQLAGTMRGATLTGGVVVQNSDIYIPELTTKRVVNLDDPEFYKIVDTSLSANRTLLPSAPSTLVRNLRVNDVSVTMGQNVWLRSSEANINLGGRVQVTVGQSTNPDRPLSLALQGRLDAPRGTYRLNLGPVQRTFEVERGALSFYGERDADLNPTLDISAVNTVRRPSRSDRDVRVHVRIEGTLAQPRLTLSGEDPRLSESDLISYLVTGQPSTDVASSTSLSAASSVLLPSLGSYVGDKLAGFGLFDVFSLQTAGLGDLAAGGTSAAYGGLTRSLQSTRANACKQVGGNVFACVNAGFCTAQAGSGDSRTAGLVDALGARLEYEFGRNGAYSLSLAADPPTSGLLCQAQARGFVNTPRQYGLDFLRHWDF